MAQQPNQLAPDTPYADNLAMINDNINKAVSDISDVGAKFSSLGSFQVTLASNTILPPYTMSVLAVNEASTRYVAGKVQVVPRFLIYEDNDQNSNYIVGYTNSQSKKAIVMMWIQQSPVAGSLADVVISIWNTDAGSHTYYVYWDVSYQDTPHSGNYR